MSYNDIKTDFTGILNRDDCSDTLADTFLRQSISRIQREARLPCMEREALVTPTADLDWFLIPSDLLQPIDILVPDEYDGRPRALEKLAFRDLMRIDPLRWPFAYSRSRGQFWIRGRVPEGYLIQCLYYGTFSPFASADAENELSRAAPDLAVYGALAFAGDHFAHPQLPAWEARYQQILGSVTEAGVDIDAEGGPQVIQSMAADCNY